MQYKGTRLTVLRHASSRAKNSLLIFILLLLLGFAKIFGAKKSSISICHFYTALNRVSLLCKHVLTNQIDIVTREKTPILSGSL